MIISHKHQFIFIKTHKTAGTSVEISLSEFCGEHDVITPISPVDERLRKSLGFRGAQNFLTPLNTYSKKDWARLALKRERLAFYNHCPATMVREVVGPEIWNSYYKVAIERNPWDKVISFYYWDYKTEPRPGLSEYIRNGQANYACDFDLYSERGELLVDHVMDFANLSGEMGALYERLGIRSKVELPRAKGGHRKDKRPYEAVLDVPSAAHIAQVFAREIAYFGYGYGTRTMQANNVEHSFFGLAKTA